MMSANTASTGNLGDNIYLGHPKSLSISHCPWMTKRLVLIIIVISSLLVIFLLANSTTGRLTFKMPERNHFSLVEHEYNVHVTQHAINEENLTPMKVAGDNAVVDCNRPSILLNIVNNTDVLVPCSSSTVADLLHTVNDNGSWQMPVRRLPKSIIIGVKKGGTGALKYFLHLHSAIAFTSREIHFFDVDSRYKKGLESYRREMQKSRTDQITMEKSPAYFVTPNVPQRIFQMNSSIRLIVVVRDPVERAVSDYLHDIFTRRIRRGRKIKSFDEMAVDANTGNINSAYGAIYRSLYDVHLMRWLRYFPLQQFLFLSAENLVADPVTELRKVENFLGLQHQFTSTRFHYSKRRGFYCMCVNERKAGAKSNEDIGLEEKCLPPSKGRRHPIIDPNVTQKLREFFRPHNERLYSIIGTNFCWK